MAFDLEIAKVLPENAADLMAYRPLGISCAATLKDDGELVLWYGETANKAIAGRMERREVEELVLYLQEAAKDGYSICTWNGLGFDFDILAEESNEIDRCRVLALNHVDMMFQFFCLKGFPISLDNAAKGMGLSGKFEALDGAIIPELWASGEHHKVLAYLTQDVRMTLGLARAVDRIGRICWTSSRGRLAEVPISRWMLAREALALPEPDTSWMNNPWPRSKFDGWTGKGTRRLF